MARKARIVRRVPRGRLVLAEPHEPFASKNPPNPETGLPVLYGDMSSARRAFDILRGYVNHGWDSLQGGTESDAERELREAMDQATKTETTPGPTLKRLSDPPMSIDVARRLLDVPEGATSRDIAEAHERLKVVADPGKFVEGSAAHKRASDLQRRLESAKRVLVDNLDPTIKRFEGLEIE